MKKAIVTVVAILAVMVGFSACNTTPRATTTTSGSSPIIPAAGPTIASPAEVVVPAVPNMTTSQASALRRAESYISTMPFSKKGLIKQLSQFEKFPKADAEFAVNHLTVDWNEQADLKAQSYMDTVGGFSKSSLTTQLTRFEGFTASEAAHGVASVGLK